MSIHIIEPGQPPRPATADERAALGSPPSIETLRAFIGCAYVEIIPGVRDYDGEPADMVGDENAALDGRLFNAEAVSLRDAALGAAGHRPSPNPLFGAVLILTGADRLE